MSYTDGRVQHPMTHTHTHTHKLSKAKHYVTAPGTRHQALHVRKHAHALTITFANKHTDRRSAVGTGRSPLQGSGVLGVTSVCHLRHIGTGRSPLQGSGVLAVTSVCHLRHIGTGRSPLQGSGVLGVTTVCHLRHICPYTNGNSPLSGRIFVIFYTGDFY
jgi:hypothetical protein